MAQTLPHFTIDSDNGQLRVGSAALDYYKPADVDLNNNYEFTVTVSDGVAADDNGGSDSIGSDSIDVTVTVKRADADATLSGLTISAGTLSPTFASDITSYTASVANSVSGVTLTPTASHAGATITVGRTAANSGFPSDTQELFVGANAIDIIVTAEDVFTTKTYTVTVTRAAPASSVTVKRAAPASTDATLSALTISHGALESNLLGQIFSSDITSYTASVANSVSGVTLTPTANHAGATIAVAGTTVASGSPSGSQTLGVGSNTIITIVVTAQDGSTTKTYTVTVTRAAPSTDATLSGLAISAGTLDPTFTSGTYIYDVSIPFNIFGSTVTLTPTAKDPNATITVAGAPVGSGNVSPGRILYAGLNTVRITVTAEDGSTRLSYDVRFTRTSLADASADRTLSGLTISHGTLTPNFNPSVIFYTASVPYNVSGVTLTPTANHPPYATVLMEGVVVTSGAPRAARPLKVGDNKIPIIVVAEDNTSLIYRVIVTRAAPASAPSNDTSLSGLTISPSKMIGRFLYKRRTTYIVEAPDSVTSVTVTPTASHAGATITVGGTAVNSGSPSGAQALNFGETDIDIIVTAEDGTTTKTYTVKVTRPLF